MKKTDVSHIFGEEFEVLNNAKSIVSQNSESSNSLYPDFAALVKSYEKLLNNTIKLTTISDSQHLNLMAVQEKLIKANEELELLSVTDRLTNLYNRVKFDALLNIEIHKSKRTLAPLSLILLDIDHFKKINDTYGHLLGDKILISFSDIIKKNIRPYDIPARWGGEEFLLLLPNTNRETAFQVAERLRITIESNIFVSDIRMTASFGVAQFSENMSADDFIELADDGLYNAKQHGRNRVGGV